MFTAISFKNISVGDTFFVTRKRDGSVREFYAGALDPINREPACAPVAGTLILWVSNTENDPFRHKATGASSCQLAKAQRRNRDGVVSVGGLAGGLRRTSGTADSIQRLSVTHQRLASRPGTTPTPAPSGEVPVVYGPFDDAGGFAAYYPRTGTYARGGVVDGPYDSRAVPTRGSNEEF